jgi:hypothetical protein
VAERQFLPDGEVLAQLVSVFDRADPDKRELLYQTLGTYLHGPVTRSEEAYGGSSGRTAATVANFTEDRSLSAKEFITQKQPTTEVERVACLAYYLTHYMGTPHFKTVDISRVNTEAAQIKLSNATVAVNNALQRGYLAHAVKGFKQISALGEEYVAALPDREGARAIMTRRRRPRRKSKATPSPNSGEPHDGQGPTT